MERLEVLEGDQINKLELLKKNEEKSLFFLMDTLKTSPFIIQITSCTAVRSVTSPLITLLLRSSTAETKYIYGIYIHTSRQETDIM